MKKLLSLVLSIALLLGLFACGETHDAITYDVIAPRPVDKPIRMTMYGADGNPQSATTYEYNQKGDVLRSEQRMANGDTYTNTYENHYNEKGQLVERYNGDRLVTYVYNDDGQLIQTGDDTYADIDLGGATEYTYNQQGQLIQSDFVGHDTSWSASLYAYDDQGLLIRNDVYMYYLENDKKPDKPSYYYLYEYE